jgi:hypothetical protein
VVGSLTRDQRSKAVGGDFASAVQLVLITLALVACGSCACAQLAGVASSRARHLAFVRGALCVLNSTRALLQHLRGRRRCETPCEVKGELLIAALLAPMLRCYQSEHFVGSGFLLFAAPRSPRMRQDSYCVCNACQLRAFPGLAGEWFLCFPKMFWVVSCLMIFIDFRPSRRVGFYPH